MYTIVYYVHIMYIYVHYVSNQCVLSRPRDHHVTVTTT